MQNRCLDRLKILLGNKDMNRCNSIAGMEEDAEGAGAGVPDMTLMPQITEEAINDNLRARYERDQIYTYTGSILIAVNPYKELGYYSTELMQGYRGRTFAELPPHVFALAEAAYKSLQSGEKNQSVVISGESGAGKTETTKLILQYLCAAGGQATWAEQQILEANTVLEAFGNAKTVRNDNSSRFGKFVEVRLDSKGGIRGAVLRDFLLERARITGPAPRETNYHVFYQLVNGARHNQELAESLCLRPGVHFTYLRAEEEEGGGAAAAGAAEEDARRLDALRLALTVLQVAPHMLEGLFKVLAAILWLGNIQFEDVDGEHSALSHEDTEAVNAVSSLLGIALPTAQRVLLERQINVRGNVTDIPLRLPDARENRHGMARALYARTFAWLVRHVNGCSAPGREASRALGVLDIFGFENFAKNSLEQLCINYANEKLHMFFNNYVFSLEQEIYRQEGIVYNPIQYTDNAVCLELLEKPPRSLLKLLSEQCHMPKGSDSAYLTNIQGEFEEHPNFVKGPRRRWEEEFSVDHYAGAVAYNVQGFVDKNRDTQQDAFVDHLSRANNPFVRELADYVQDLSPPTQEYGSCSPGTNTTQRGTSKGRPTVVDTFRAQLQSLVDMLQATDVWYVRCIKPNTSKEAGKYNQALVREQLKYLGMLEIVRIRRDGFPVHLPISEFVSKYRCLLQHPRPKEPAISEIMAVVVASQNDWQVGHSKVFMRSSVHAPLEAKRTALVQASALRLQKWYKGSMERCRYCVTRRAVITLQSAWRGWRERAAFLRLRRSTLTLQRHLRGAFAREVAAALREMRRVEREMALREERNRQAEKASQELAQLAQVRGLAATAASCGTPPSAGADSVNLDNLFDFLADVSGQQRGAPDGESANHQPTIAEIGDTMDRLAGEMDDELEQVIQAEKLDDICVRPEVGPGKVDVLERCGDGAPRDAYPPPPPPIGPPPPPPLIEMNGIDTPKPKVSSSKTNGTGEPIYEAVIPRTEPPTTLEPLPPPPPLEPPPPTQMSPPQYANGYRAMPGSGSPSPTSDALPLPPTLTNGTLSRSPSPPPPPPHDDFSLAPPTPAVSPPPIDNGFMQNPERDARRKVRVEKRLNQMETPAQLNGQPADAGHDLIHYAKNFFNEHPRSPDGTIIATLTRKSKAMEAMSKEEMLCYHKGNTIPTSHIQLHDPDSVAAACSIFRDLCRYMRGELTPDKETQVIQSIIAKGLEREELRDEILVQCMRQITDCPSVEWSERVWLILCLAAVAWQAGRGLARYYVWWLRGCLRSAQVASRPAHCAQWCLDNCRGAAPRALPPSTVEIAAMRRLGTIVCRFFFLDGRTKAIDVHPADTAAAAAARLADKLELSAGARQGWAVYQQRPAGEEHVRGHHYLYDVIAAWEMQQGAGGGSADNRFVFKRRLFRGGRELPHDPVEVALLYAQAVHSVVKLDEFPVSEKVALQLAGLQAQVSLGEPPPVSPTAQSRTAYADASQFMPQRIARSRPQNQWATILAQAHRQYGAGRAELTAKALYLSCVMQYPLYGVTLFPVIYKGYWPHGPSVLLGVGAEGIVLVRPTDKVVLAEHRYPDIAALLMDPVDDCLTISLAHHAHHDGHRCIVLETSQKCEAAWLIASYSPALGAALAEEPSRRAAPAAERARLAAALRAARRAAAHAGLLRKPSDTHGGFLRNTLKRLSKHRLDRMKVDSTESQNESYKGFPPDWWAWSRSLTHSLTRLNEAEEVAAMQMFKDIMTHAGFHVGAGNTSSNGSTGSLTTATIKEVEGEDRMTLAQALLQRCLQKDTLLCELYMQLIIQTTEHPEARSCSAARHWSMLCACAGTALPPARPLRRLLLAHLRYHGLDHIGEMGKFARFAEQVALATAASTSRRQLAPSREELLCAAARRPLHARVLLLDGRQHGLVFGPSTTASQLVQMLREKIGLSTTATGYALYEVCGSAVGGGERALAAAERAADVLARWERGGATAAARRLVFKKRLFLGERPLQAACAAERELLYHQVLHALRHDRLPIDTDEAVMLAALHAQAVSGDCAGGVEECGEAARAVLPARLTLPAPAVRMHHLALRGTLPAHAMQRALTLAQSWPLHRATIFDVMQSFTSNWPRALWLAVDVRGLTLLRHRTRQALVSYDHEQLLAVSPAPRALLLVTAAERKQSKVVLSTDQAYQIATLIKDYIEIVRGPVTPALAPPEATAANQNVQCTISQQPQQVS